MEIQARLTHDKLNHSQDNHVQLVVSLTAPQLDWVAKRPKICVVPVIDLSGSMLGAKIEYAKKSMEKLVDQLQPGDITGLVGFSARAKVLMEPQAVTAEVKTKLKGLIRGLTPNGGTNFCEGALEAIRLIEGLDLGPQYIKRAILFTDGEPSSGIVDKVQILRLVKENLGSTTVSAFGYAGDGTGMYNTCDQAFLTNIAQTGQGNYAFVKDPDDSLTAFGRELGGLLSTYAQNIAVEVEPLNGHQITRAVTDVAITQNVLGETEFQLSDILSEETRHFVFDVKLNQGKAGPRAVNIFQVKAAYSVITSDGQRETKTLETKVKVQFVSESEAQKEPNKELDEVVALAQVIRAQIEAEEKAKLGQYDLAAQIMQNTAHDVKTRGYIAMGRVAESVQHKVSSRSLYAGSEGYLRSMQSAGTRAYGTSSMDAEARADLSFCDVSLGNSSMNQTVMAFANNNPSVAVQPDLSNVIWTPNQAAPSGPVWTIPPAVPMHSVQNVYIPTVTTVTTPPEPVVIIPVTEITPEISEIDPGLPAPITHPDLAPNIDMR